MQQIAEWLGSLGLGQYTQRFDENGIDVSVLRHLTDADLAALGVLLGHRRKMLAAIADLTGAVPSATPLPPSTEPKPQDTAERRQVTVMFSDLVGSTALSARMDPEDLREVISAYQKSVAETVSRFGGFVAKYMGDGVLVVFWLSPGPRGRPRACCACRTEVGDRCSCSEDPRARAGACRYCDRIGGGRRPNRIGRFSRTSQRRRYAKPCGAIASACRARCHRHWRLLALARRDRRFAIPCLARQCP